MHPLPRAQISITPAGGEEASHVMSWLLIGTLTVRVTTITEMQASVPRARKTNSGLPMRERIRANHATLDRI